LPLQKSKAYLDVHSTAVSTLTNDITYTRTRSEVVEALNQSLYAHSTVEGSKLSNDSNQMSHRQTSHSSSDRQASIPKAPETLDTLADSAFLCERQGRLVEAERLYIKVISLRARQLGKTHLSVAGALSDLAALYIAQSRYTEAEPLLYRALQIRTHRLSFYHSDIAENCYQLACIYRQQQQYDRAEPLFQRALSAMRRQLGAEHPRTRIVYDDLMQMLATVIDTGQYHTIARPLPPLDLDNLSDRYSWAKPDWHTP